MLVLLFALLGTVTAFCPPGYSQINGGDCFVLYSTNQTTFVDAEAECRRDGGHLASVHSIEEQHGLVSLMNGTSPLIGMKCDDEALSNCTWTDGSAVDYANFPGGLPVLSYGGCVQISSTDDMWYSWNCAAPIDSFLCRVANEEPVTIPVVQSSVAMTTVAPTTTKDYITNCPKQQYTADTYVFSPNYPSPYPVLVDCLYFIEAKNNRKLTIEFEFVDTPKGSDVVTVYDGPNTQSRVIANVSGKNGASIWQYYSTGSKLTLEFVSNSTTGGKGWSAAVYNV